MVNVISITYDFKAILAYEYGCLGYRLRQPNDYFAKLKIAKKMDAISILLEDGSEAYYSEVENLKTKS
ncbi:MAG: hypothetical protein U0T69_11230 [Chitinophagales bacterium]